jgi:predicted nucleic acid-binding protein
MRGIIVKLFFEEDHSEAAERCVRTLPQLSAPELIWVEAMNVIRKRCRRGDLTPNAAADIAAALLDLLLRIHESAGLIADALRLAIQFDRADRAAGE